MSKKRYVSDAFWSDNWIEELDPLEKLLFLYLITNEHVSICGFYEIKDKRIAFETGIDRDMVLKIIKRFQDAKKIFYEDGIICIVNFVKNQNIKNENDNLWKGIVREIEDVGLDKLKNILANKDLIRTLQGAYKDVPIPYLTLLNLTLLNLTISSKEEIPHADFFKNEKSEEILEKENFSLIESEKSSETSQNSKTDCDSSASAGENNFQNATMPTDLAEANPPADITANNPTIPPESGDILAGAGNQESGEIIEKKEYGNPDVNAIIRAIRDAHGTVDGTVLMQRRYGGHLKKKIERIEGFNGDFYTFVYTICTKSDKYRISKTVSPQVIYDNLALLIANVKEALFSNENSTW